MMQPHMISQCASAAQPAAPEDEPVGGKLEKKSAERFDQVRADEARRQEDRQPRRQYIRVGGRCSHIA